jgi:hypothetical protein
MRLSIELTPEQHQRLKAVAALRGQSIKDYVLEHVLPSTPTGEESAALRQLEAFLEPRIQAANGVFGGAAGIGAGGGEGELTSSSDRIPTRMKCSHTQVQDIMVSRFDPQTNCYHAITGSVSFIIA